MKRWLSSLPMSAWLGLIAICLGVAGLFFDNPYDRATATIDTAELAENVQREVDHVSPEQLADWIIQGTTDYRLIDLRTDAEYGQYHIPGAENVGITGLADHGLFPEREDRPLLRGRHSLGPGLVSAAGEGI